MILQKDPDAMGIVKSLQRKKTRQKGRGTDKGKEVACYKCGVQGHVAPQCASTGYHEKGKGKDKDGQGRGKQRGALQSDASSVTSQQRPVIVFQMLRLIVDHSPAASTQHLTHRSKTNYSIDR